jgi:hypothetical protein
MSLEVKIGGFKNIEGDESFPDRGKFVVAKEEDTLTAYFAGDDMMPLGIKHYQVVGKFGLDEEQVVGGATYELLRFPGKFSLILSEGSSDYGTLPSQVAEEIANKARDYLASKGIEIAEAKASCWRLSFSNEKRLWKDLGYKVEE